LDTFGFHPKDRIIFGWYVICVGHDEAIVASAHRFAMRALWSTMSLLPGWRNGIRGGFKTRCRKD
jgi:hypothetical protein